jgi:hypothetical protein
MSAYSPLRTSLVAPNMSALGGKADMNFASHMSAFDPKRTCERGTGHSNTMLRRGVTRSGATGGPGTGRACHPDRLTRDAGARRPPY